MKKILALFVGLLPLPAILTAADAPRISPINFIQEQGPKITQVWHDLVRHAMDNGAPRGQAEPPRMTGVLAYPERFQIQKGIWAVRSAELAVEKPFAVILPQARQAQPKLVTLLWNEREPEMPLILRGRPERKIKFKRTFMRLELTAAGDLLLGSLEVPRAARAKFTGAQLRTQIGLSAAVNKYTSQALTTLGRLYRFLQ